MRPPSTTLLRHRAEDVRRFNRFYTRQIGLLHEGLLQSPFSLTEVRVLYELAHRDLPIATDLGNDLGLDPGYLSRILRSFQKRGFLVRTISKTDARQSLLALTKRGRDVFSPLDKRAREEVTAMLAKLAGAKQRRLLEAMSTIETLLGAGNDPATRPRTPYLLRTHAPGDMGWVVYRHGTLYAQEHGYSDEFEALVARIAADFLKNFDAKRERCWIAERDAEIAGSVFLVKKSEKVAQLRLLLVEPSARGLGIGRRLVSETIRFAREAGYRRIVLWTQSDLYAARHLYEEAGFRVANRERHDSFGKHLVAETWELKL
jgi:DNA-binding MarR family transcriptional regulator/GNAT superfamily N-acetyltransferase